MADLLIAWGVAQAVGFIFKPILEDLAKDAAKDFAKDFLKDSLKHVLLPDKEPLNIAIGKAIKEFLQLVQQQLEVADLSEAEQKQYTEPLKQFLKNKSVKEVLGSAFKDDCQGLDTKKLAKIWNELNLLPLPDEFSWKQVNKPYLNKVKAIIRESPQLRAILDSQNIEATAQNTKELAGIVPGFELAQYQEAIRERYGNLNLQSLDTTGAAYNELKLWRMFIAQNVREFNDILPQIHELPKEHLRQLKEGNHLEAEISLEQLEQSKRVYVEQPIRPVLDVINDAQTYKYVVMLGDPGSGKSTLLQYLALNWAESPLNNIISQPIPLLIELRTYMRSFDSGECKNFLEFFHKGSGSICHLNQHQLHEQLKAGKALVMFDGLDEVFDPGKREDVITCIHRFTNEYPKVQVIVTSRVIGYKHQRLRDAEFRHFMLQDLGFFRTYCAKLLAFR